METENKEIVIVFNSILELNNWWCSNPRAIRTEPKIEAKTLEEYNRKNHSITFPCEMHFTFPNN